MITIPQPSMALNSSDTNGYCRMWNTRDVADDVEPEVLLQQVRDVAVSAPGGKLECLVINCHGYYHGVGRQATGGYGLKIGTGIKRAHAPMFGILKKPDGGTLVRNVIITACGTARISPIDKNGNGDGNMFCSEIAQASGAIVTAATTKQIVDANWWRQPFGQISDWEGLVLQYGPLGNVIWSNDYGRSWIDNLVHGSN